jgi:hypothetical protein
MLDVDLVNLRAKLYSFTTVQGTTISVLKSSFAHLLAVWQKRKGGVGSFLRRLVDALHLHLRTHSPHTRFSVSQGGDNYYLLTAQFTYCTVHQTTE